MSEPVTIRDVRLKAAELIEEHGWFQGHDERSGPQAQCAATALHAAAMICAPDPEDVEVRLRLRCEAADAVCAELGCGVLIDWNDAPGRTKDEVVAALRGGS